MRTLPPQSFCSESDAGIDAGVDAGISDMAFFVFIPIYLIDRLRVTYWSGLLVWLIGLAYWARLKHKRLRVSIIILLSPSMHEKIIKKDSLHNH